MLHARSQHVGVFVRLYVKLILDVLAVPRELGVTVNLAMLDKSKSIDD